MSKSANYCYAHLSNGTGLLLLCEVAAKPFYERTQAEYNADQGCKSANALYVGYQLSNAYTKLTKLGS